MNSREEYGFSDCKPLDSTELAHQLRKSAKEHILLKKRVYSESKNNNDVCLESNLDFKANMPTLCLIEDPSLLFIELMKYYSNCKQNDAKLPILSYFNKYLQKYSRAYPDNLVAALLKIGVFQMLVNELSNSSPTINLIVLGILINIAANENSDINNSLMKIDMLDKLKPHLHSKDNGIKKDAIWLVANMVSSPSLKQYILSRNFIEYLLDVLGSADTTLGLLQIISYSFSNICKTKDALDSKCIHKINPALLQLVNYANNEIVASTLNGIYYLTLHSMQDCTCFIEKDFLIKCINRLVLYDTDLCEQSIRIIINITSLSSNEVELLLQCGLLEALKTGFDLYKDDLLIIKEFYMMLSNLAAEPCEHLKLLIENGFIERMVQDSQNNDFNIQLECLYGIANLFFFPNYEQFKLFLGMNLISIMANFLILYKSNDKVVDCILISLMNALKICKLWNLGEHFYEVLESNDMISAIDSLSISTGTKMYENWRNVRSEIDAIQKRDGDLDMEVVYDV